MLTVICRGAHQIHRLLAKLIATPRPQRQGHQVTPPHLPGRDRWREAKRLSQRIIHHDRDHR